MDIVVVDVKHHGHSGYIEVIVRAEDGSRQGPLRTYGIDATVFKKHYGGNLDTWLQVVKNRHLEHAGIHESLTNALKSYKGKKL